MRSNDMNSDQWLTPAPEEGVELKSDPSDSAGAGLERMPHYREIGLRADLLSAPNRRLSSWIKAGTKMLRGNAPLQTGDAIASSRWQQVSMMREPVGSTVNLLCDEPLVKGTLLELAVPRRLDPSRPPLRVRIEQCEPGGSGGFFYIVRGEVEA
jgi:hypothetical protein